MGRSQVCERIALPDTTAWYVVRDQVGSHVLLTSSQTLILYQFLHSHIDQLRRDAAYTPKRSIHEWKPP